MPPKKQINGKPAKKPCEPATPPAQTSPRSLVSDDRPWKIAQLAAALLSGMNLGSRGVEGLKANPSIASAKSDPLFAAALKRADQLLAWANGQGGDVCAYQLFPEGVVFTELKIMKEFQSFDWSNLSSKAPVMDMMKMARDEMENEMEAEERRYDSSSVGDMVELHSIVVDSMRNGFEHHFGRRMAEMPAPTKHAFEDLIAILLERLPQHFANGGSLERYENIREKREFFAWCFPAATSEQKAERLYRPHEIFRRCRSRGWFNTALIRPREKLTKSLVPFPPSDLEQEEFTEFDAYFQNTVGVSSFSQSSR